MCFDKFPFCILAKTHYAPVYFLVFFLWVRCNILIRVIFHYTQGTYINRYFVCAHPWGCTVHSLACTAQTERTYGNGASVYICTCGAVKYCASKNVTPAMLLNSSWSPMLVIHPDVLRINGPRECTQIKRIPSAYLHTCKFLARFIKG